MSLDDVSKWMGVFALMLSVGNVLWAWISRPARDLGTRVDKIEMSVEENDDQTLQELKKHDRRIQRVEDEIRHLPTKADVSRVENEITSVKTELAIVHRVVDRLDDFLRSKA
ncbi:MAG: DUF2730 family protein [Sphingomonadales bacterium]|nr:DUF2730 family protein [Sphingomonadales bacterium]MDE2171343.1 DUF2730 family protein [Sphingomonadales bacterium]